MAYTYRDPLDDYNAQVRNSEPAYKPPPLEPGRRGGMAGALIAVAIIAVMMAYGANRSSNGTAKGPSSTILAPVTDGHGGTAR
jgi:hypothetical protein